MKNLLYIFTFIITTTVIAQNTTSIAFEKQKLAQAKAYGDEDVIAATLYNIIALEGPKSVYKDSLAYVYFKKAKYISCFLVTNDLLKDKPENMELLEMNAISLESMGALKKAREMYAKLFSKTNNIYHAYNLASIEYRMNKFEEAYASANKAYKLPNTADLKVTFQVNENYNQNVDLKAAIAYLKGLIAQSLTKNAEAKANYERAIQLFPDFVLAKSKLEILNAQLEENKD